MNCPAIEKFLAWVCDATPSSEAELLRGHLAAGCQDGQRQVIQLREIQRLTREWVLENPPAWLLRQATALFDMWQSAPRSSLLRRIFGVLVVDSFVQPAFMGVRQGRRTSRQLLYRASDYDVDLCLNYDRPSRSVELVGQANPLNGDLASVADSGVKLINSSGAVWKARTNQFGWFLLQEVPEGTYNLSIRLRREEIQIAGLPVAPDND